MNSFEVRRQIEAAILLNETERRRPDMATYDSSWGFWCLIVYSSYRDYTKIISVSGFGENLEALQFTVFEMPEFHVFRNEKEGELNWTVSDLGDNRSAIIELMKGLGTHLDLSGSRFTGSLGEIFTSEMHMRGVDNTRIRMFKPGKIDISVSFDSSIQSMVSTNLTVLFDEIYVIAKNASKTDIYGSLRVKILEN